MLRKYWGRYVNRTYNKRMNKKKYTKRMLLVISYPSKKTMEDAILIIRDKTLTQSIKR